MSRIVIGLLTGIVLAAPAWAELNDRQQAAFDVIVPALEVAIAEQGGEQLLPMVPILATCIVETAKRRELTTLSAGEIGLEEAALMNEIMTRPKTQGCVARGAN